jgi:hypothetical protein
MQYHLKVKENFIKGLFRGVVKGPYQRFFTQKPYTVSQCTPIHFSVYAHKQSTALHTPLFTKHTVAEENALQTSYRFSRKSGSKTAEGNSCVALKYVMTFTATVFPELTHTQRMAVRISSDKLYPGLNDMCIIREKFYLAFD